MQGLVDFDGFDEVGGKGIELNLPHTGFRRGDVHAIDGGIGQSRFGAADLHVFALAFVALEGDARQTAKGVRHVRIRQAGDHFVGKNLKNVVGGALAVNVFGLARGALGGHENLILLRGHCHFCVDGGGFPRRDIERLCKQRKANISYRNGVSPRSEVINEVAPLRIGDDGDRGRLQFHLRALQDAAG